MLHHAKPLFFLNEDLEQHTVMSLSNKNSLKKPIESTFLLTILKIHQSLYIMELCKLQFNSSVIKFSTDSTAQVILGWKSNVCHHLGIIPLSSLARVSKYMTLQKRRLLMSSYITSQFNYCPLVWIIHDRKLNKKINEVHARALRIVYGDHKTKFSELLNTDTSVTIH